MYESSTADQKVIHIDLNRQTLSSLDAASSMEHHKTHSFLHSFHRYQTHSTNKSFFLPLTINMIIQTSFLCLNLFHFYIIKKSSFRFLALATAGFYTIMGFFLIAPNHPPDHDFSFVSIGSAFLAPVYPGQISEPL